MKKSISYHICEQCGGLALTPHKIRYTKSIHFPEEIGCEGNIVYPSYYTEREESQEVCMNCFVHIQQRAGEGSVEE